MRLAAVRTDDVIRYGVVAEDTIRFDPAALSALQVDGAALGEAQPLRYGSPALVAPDAPLVRNLFCVGWNYAAHFEEGKQPRGPNAPSEIPDHPAFFSKATTSLIGPFDPIEAHSSLTRTLDWEVELAVVIGRSGRDIPPVRALAMGDVIESEIEGIGALRNVVAG